MPFFPFRTRREFLRGSALLLILAGVAGYWFYDQFLGDLPDLRRVEDYRPSLTSVVLDRHGRLDHHGPNHRLDSVRHLDQVAAPINRKKPPSLK